MIRAVFMGTGVSTGLPRISCVTQGRNSRGGILCPVCKAGLENELSPNRRGNVALLLQSAGKNVLIDCGKTFREVCLRWYPKYDVKWVDAVILTHGHADAVGGIDDLRDAQNHDYPLPVFLNAATRETCHAAYPYLFRRPDPNVPRRVARIDWVTIENTEAFKAAGIDVQALPLYHGGDYICLGFAFKTANPFVYLSDLTAIPDETWRIIKSLSHISVLVVDALNRTGHNAHLSLPQAVELVKEIRPEKAFFIGMTCSLGLHETVSEELLEISKDCGIDMKLAYDGMELEF